MVSRSASGSHGAAADRRFVGRNEFLFAKSTSRFGIHTILFRVGAAVITLAGVTLSLEAIVGAIDPQEVQGWGERPALRVHEDFGWYLIPDRATRLRWGGYDYVVESNHLGFPGPLYPEDRTPDSYRIITLGDAFTSAEGVDTDESWPRLLERKIRDRLEPTSVEVLNFAITGYGPNQYAAVLGEYGPRYLPDLVVIGFSVNDYFDVLVSDSEFQAWIGLSVTEPSLMSSCLQASHLRKWLQTDVWEPAQEAITRRPRPYGYFLGDFRCFEANSKVLTNTGFLAVEDRLSQIKATADAMGASLVLALIPAPVQVCARDELSYYPQSVDLGDASKYDLDLPQRLTQKIAHDLGIMTYDLRDPLCTRSTCPYHPHNRHWLPSGHQVVARFLCDALIRDGYAKPSRF